MHSTLRKELCGTPKILQSVRTRSAKRFSTRHQSFSTKTYLSQESDSKDGSNNSSGTAATPLDPSSDPANTSSAPSGGIVAAIEQWIQIQRDKGQPQSVWDPISERDESGTWRLLPRVKNDLERLTSSTPQDNKTPQTFAIEIKDGHIRRLSESEIEETRSSKIGDSLGGKPNTRSSDRDSNSAASAAVQFISADQNTNRFSSKLGRGQADTQQPFPTGENEAPQNLDNLVSKFHGSSAARRQRERQSRLREKEPAVSLPEWFLERNIIIWGQNALATSKASRVHSMWDLDEVTTEATPVEAKFKLLLPDASDLLEHSDKPNSDEKKPPVNKEQTLASSPDSNEPPKGEPPPGSNAVSKSNLGELVALSNTSQRYHIHSAQRTELILTARGRLRLPASGSSINRPGGIRSHLLVHYTAIDGDLFLDRLIEDVARQLRCNLITLDVQDIAALIAKADIDPMMTDEAKTLSYDVYGDIYKDDLSEDEQQQSMFPEDMEDGDEEGPPGPQGIPFMVGKPITIDLKALFGPGSGDRDAARRNRHASFIKRLDMATRSSISKPLPHVFQSLIESILSSPSNKRKMLDESALQQTKDESLDGTAVSQILPQDATIVHVKDLKAIQETSIGKQFLAQLYDQVERRRSAGEGIMLVGTSCERNDPPSYDPERIRSLQVSEPDEISSPIVITPAHWDLVVGLDPATRVRRRVQRKAMPRLDRSKRILTINARHLFEMLQSKDIPVDQLKDGFWSPDSEKQLSDRDQECLSEGFWSFSHVQRVAAILASSDFSKLSDPIARAASILERSDKLKYSWTKETQPEKPQQGKKEKDPDNVEDPKLASIRAKASKHEKKLLGGVIEPKKISTTFKDIHIPAETIDALQTLTTLSLVRPDAFKYGVLASDRIPGLLLYGPPGTGKTLAAKAVARESGATMLEVSAADINDMYVGEGEKNVKALFSLAKKLSPCVVFLDEADAMFSARSNFGRRASHRELLNQFLKEWDGMSNDSGSAFIMVATNRPMDLDDAVLRRLPRRLLVDLPTEKDRLEILKIHLRQEHLADDVDLGKLAGRTQFYSGSDLKNVAVAAALNCVREENESARNYSGDEPYKYPSTRTLTATHFDSALEEISASISEDMRSLRDIKKFDEQYGDRKGRKRRSPKWGFKTAAEADAVLDTVKVRS